MNRDLFLLDLEAKPRALRALAEVVGINNPWSVAESVGLTTDSHVVFVGMGSSHYANAIAAARLRALGITAVAEIASSDLLPAPRSSTLVIAVSASGTSTETLDAVARYAGRCPIIGLVNVEGSALTSMVDHTVLMQAGVEAGGVACRSFQHTLGLLLSLQEQLVPGSCSPVAHTLSRAADATEDLLDRRDEWLAPVAELALGPQGTFLTAPAHRLSSAQQGALMLREGPRRLAVGCETGDWSHVDVYLTKTMDYRLIAFAGSRWQSTMADWVRQRQSTVVAVGGEVEASAYTLRFHGDDVDDVRLLAEVLVPELLAASVWTEITS